MAPATEESKGRTICTHNGSFHCDEVLACFMLTRYTSKYRGAKIVRSRDPAVWKSCDCLVDVGGEYNLAESRFDHHQKSFEDVFDKDNEKYNLVKLSSAGLIYKHFGREVVSEILKEAGIELPKDVEEIIYLKTYKKLIEEVDGVDNGVDQWEVMQNRIYAVTTTLGGRVKALNPAWNEPQTDEIAMECFIKAMELVGSVLVSRVHGFAKYWYPARKIVSDAYEQRTQIHESGEIMKLNHFCPWKAHLRDIEEEREEEIVKYVLFEDQKGSWRIQCVSKEQGSFANRKTLPTAWLSLRNEELDKAVGGIPGAVFVHTSGFIGGHKTYEGALDMAIKAVHNKEAESGDCKT